MFLASPGDIASSPGEMLEAPHPLQVTPSANTGYTVIIVVNIAALIVFTNNTSESFLFIKIFFCDNCV